MDLDLWVMGPEEAVLVPVRLPNVQQEPGRLEPGDVRRLVARIRHQQEHVDEGLAVNPGTEVEPTCSTTAAIEPNA